MKGALTFTLPDEQHEWNTVVRAKDWRAVVEEALSALRSARKYDNWQGEAQPQTVQETVAWIESYIRLALRDRGLDEDA